MRKPAVFREGDTFVQSQYDIVTYVYSKGTGELVRNDGITFNTDMLYWGVLEPVENPISIFDWPEK